MLFLVALIPLTWMHFVWNRCKDPHDEHEGNVPQPRNKLLHFMYQTSIKVILQRKEINILLFRLLFTVSINHFCNGLQVVWSALLRTTLYLVITIMLAVCAMFDMLVRISPNEFESLSYDLPKINQRHSNFSSNVKTRMSDQATTQRQV